MIRLAITALLLGIITSFPLGALGSYMLKKALDKGFWAGFSVSLIASFLDFVYCFSSLLGFYFIIGKFWWRFSFQLFGLVFLLYIGYHSLLKDRDFSFFPLLRRKNFSFLNKGVHDFLSNGLIVGAYYFLNPALWAFWISFAPILHATVLKESSILSQFVFSLFVGIGGTIPSFFIIKTTLKRKKYFFHPSSFGKRIILIVYFSSLAVFGLYLFKELISKVVIH